MKLVTLITLSVLVLAASASTWAVLIAGSNGWGNYRHQSDVFHAYQILTRNGVPKDQIITLAYDDLANYSANPYKGQIFNKPNGKDVYANVTIDYKGKDVSAANFLAVLTGDSKAAGGKKVLNSTANDNVFIFFSDHGAVGLVAIINSYLYADQLNTALKTMNTKKMYNKLVFYLEACESGSMFANLPKDINIYAATASNAVESSWATYCSPNDVVNGKRIGSCLGDEFSVTWMEDTDAYDVTNRTLDDQFNQILKNVKQSHPQKYGNLSFLNDTLSKYHGNSAKRAAKASIHPLLATKLRGPATLGLVDSRLSTLASLRSIYEANPNNKTLAAYNLERASMAYFDRVFQQINSAVGKSAGFLQARSPQLPQELSCLRSAVNSFESSCRKFSDYGLKYVRTLANLCYTEKMPATKINDLVKTVCKA
jgi:legumain